MPRKEAADENSINHLVHQLCAEMITMRKDILKLEDEVRLATLASDAQGKCVRTQADVIETFKREENIWRERMRKALNYANFQPEMQTILQRDKDKPF